MKNLETLSFKNVVREDFQNNLFEGKISFKVVNDSNEVLAEVKGNEISLREFTTNYFYNQILKPELDYVFEDILSDADKILANNMSVNEYVNFVNDKYREYERELDTFNELFNVYTNLIDYLSKNKDIDNYCFVLNSICANYDGTGAGTLLINYLKEHYNLIYLYSIAEIESFFLGKVSFKEIINGYLYWTNEEKLEEIL